MSAISAAERANRLLAERGTVVWGAKGCKGWSANITGDALERWNLTGLLINIQPIEKPADTAESLLWELVDKVKNGGWTWAEIQVLCDRARKLLEKERP
jgi:hypothetical protein